MTLFRVWAPRPSKVELQIGGSRFPMEQEGRGWWSLNRPEAGAGTDYSFVLDDGKPLPDPRSMWQPQGIHGPSRLVDHAAFSWSDQGWQAPPLSSAVIYELHPGTFTPSGSFDGIIDRLDYLADLGVTHVELMPVAEFSGNRGWGYDGVDMFAPHHAYGGPDGLKRLVNACHSRGLAVILDVVYNHLGPAGNYLDRFGPYFSDRYGTPWGLAVNFDSAGSNEVRRFVCDNALMWLRDYHMDGLRIDAIHAIFDMSAVHILEQLSAEVDALEAQIGRRLVLIAESDLNDPRVIRPREAHGYGMDAQWSDDFHHALHTVLTGDCEGYYADFGSLEDIARALTGAFVYNWRYSAYRRRYHGRAVGDLPGWRFIGFLQNHDQIGNRALGERIGHLAGAERAEIGAALLLASPFVPMLFQGEEWGASTPFLYFTNHEDLELGRAVTEGRRREMSDFNWKAEEVPDPQDAATFERSKLKWDEIAREPHARLLEWSRTLIRLRREWPELRDGNRSAVNVRHDEARRWIVMERGRVKLACNLADGRQEVPIASGQLRVLAASQAGTRLRDGVAELPANSAALLAPVA